MRTPPKTKAKEWMGKVRGNSPRGQGYRVMTLDLPARFPRADGGTFIMLSTGGEPSILLRRPMAIYDLRRKSNRTEMDILYSVIGRGTNQLSQVPSKTELSFLGPIGNTFAPPKKGERIVVVAGGVGIAPFLLWARGLSAAEKKNIKVLFGFRNKDQLPIVRDFRAIGLRPLCAVEGPGGNLRGNAVDLLEKEWKASPANRIYTCGPEKMMDRVVAFGARERVPVSVSLETKMGCGMGVCLSCVTPLPGAHPIEGYSLVCQDGAIFEIAGPQNH